MEQIVEEDPYITACSEHGVIPVSHYIKHQNDKCMKLNHRGLADKGTVAIASSIAKNEHIEELHLSDNYISNRGGKAIADALVTNKTLNSINLSNNQLGFEGGKAIVESLLLNESVTWLDLSNNKLDDRVSFPLGKSIQAEEFKVQDLNLSRNSLSERGAAVLGHSLPGNKSLVNLDLSWNSIRRKGAVILLDGLKGNTSLKKVSLSWNGLGSEIENKIGELIMENSTIEELDLRLDGSCCPAIAKALGNNKTLQKLNLSHNFLGEQGLLQILDAMKLNTTITILNLEHTNTMADEKRGAAIIKRIKEDSRVIWKNPLEKHRLTPFGFEKKENEPMLQSVSSSGM